MMSMIKEPNIKQNISLVASLPTQLKGYFQRVAKHTSLESCAQIGLTDE